MGNVVAARGRPKKLPVFSREIRWDVVQQVSEGATLTSVCKQPGFPSTSTFHKWVREDQELEKAWRLAREAQAHVLFNRALDLAQDLQKPDTEGRPGGATTVVQIRALQVAIDTYKWAAARLNPRDYGERIPVNPVIPINIHTTLNLGQEGAPLPQEGSLYKLQAITPIEVTAEEATLPEPQRQRLRGDRSAKKGGHKVV